MENQTILPCTKMWKIFGCNKCISPVFLFINSKYST